MKKIAELVIGNMIVSNTMYEDYGSPTLFIVHKDDRKSRCYYSYGYYQARCINCGAMFTVKPNITWYGGSIKVFALPAAEYIQATPLCTAITRKACSPTTL